MQRKAAGQLHIPALLQLLDALQQDLCRILVEAEPRLTNHVAGPGEISHSRREPTRINQPRGGSRLINQSRRANRWLAGHHSESRSLYDRQLLCRPIRVGHLQASVSCAAIGRSGGFCLSIG
eukprot:3165081-Pyramimonas_sp.AAC.1